MSTLPGIPFYLRRGFQAHEPVETELPDGVQLPFVRTPRRSASPA